MEALITKILYTFSIMLLISILGIRASTSTSDNMTRTDYIFTIVAMFSSFVVLTCIIIKIWI